MWEESKDISNHYLVVCHKAIVMTVSSILVRKEVFIMLSRRYFFQTWNCKTMSCLINGYIIILHLSNELVIGISVFLKNSVVMKNWIICPSWLLQLKRVNIFSPYNNDDCFLVYFSQFVLTEVFEKITRMWQCPSHLFMSTRKEVILS